MVRYWSSLFVVLGLAASVPGARADEPTQGENVSVNVPTPTPSSTAKTVQSTNEPQMETEITRKVLPNRPLLATGSTLLLGSYVPAVIGAAVSDRSGDDKMYIPVAGPWLTLKEGHSETAGQKTLLVVDGAVQGLGALMMLGSLMIPERVTHDWHLFGRNERLQLGPQYSRTGFGLGANGRF